VLMGYQLTLGSIRPSLIRLGRVRSGLPYGVKQSGSVDDGAG
jgi:hypothetical protein